MRLMFYIITVTAFVGLSFGTMAMAGGDNGYSPKPTYSFSEFTRLQKFQLEAIEDYFQSGKNLKIDGFSSSMSSWLVQMANFDRRATFRLMKDMAKLKTKAQRQQRLRLERERVAKLILKVQASINRLAGKKQTLGVKLALKSEEERQKRTITYSKGLKIWAQHPMEGTRK